MTTQLDVKAIISTKVHQAQVDTYSKVRDLKIHLTEVRNRMLSTRFWSKEEEGKNEEWLINGYYLIVT